MLGLSVLAPADGAFAQASQGRPNVVIVMTDDQAVDDMKALGRVRRLIGRPGTTFTQSYATFPLCCPSRATYLTGQYAHNHGVRGNSPPAGGFAKLDSSNTLPVWLRDAGYATAHIGKYLNRYGTKNPRQIPSGWHEWHGSVDPTTYDFFNYCINENGRLVAYGPDPKLATACPGAARRPRTYQSDLHSRKAISYIKRRAPSSEPFFLSVAYLAPHHSERNNPRGRCRGSAQPAPRHRQTFADARPPWSPGFDEGDISDKPVSIRSLPRLSSQEIARIRAEYQCRHESLLAVDEGVGAMVAALRAEHELNNTLFIFTSDNGWFYGEHRVKKGKQRVYEPSVRVPTLMRGPGVARDKRVSAPSGNIDLAATIVDVAGAQPRRTLDGVSLLELARQPSVFSGRAIVLENGPEESSTSLLAGSPAFLVPDLTTARRYDAIRKGAYKYVEYRTGERELYDLASDPFEERSVHRSPRYALVQRQLAEELRRLRHCFGASC
jgi:N-acetylglucosamine-6-sulfatase